MHVCHWLDASSVLRADVTSLVGSTKQTDYDERTSDAGQKITILAFTHSYSLLCIYLYNTILQSSADVSQQRKLQRKAYHQRKVLFLSTFLIFTMNKRPINAIN